MKGIKEFLEGCFFFFVFLKEVLIEIAKAFLNWKIVIAILFVILVIVLLN